MRIWLVIAAVSAWAASVPFTASAQAAKTERHGREFSGTASHYGRGYSGKTASGVRYDPSKLTAAHRTLPFGTKVVVTDNSTKRSVTVVVNDRGPFVKGRVIDLSYAAARALKMESRGLIRVTAAIE